MDKLLENDYIKILHFCLMLEIERKNGNDSLDVFNYEADPDDMIEELVQNIQTIAD